MPDMQDQLNAAGGIEKAMLNALDQIERYVAASQIGPDGKPSGTAVYMHMPMGYPVDPKQYANAWSPFSGDATASQNNDGSFPAATPPPAATAPPGAAAGAVYPPPVDTPDLELQASIGAAAYTSALVDNMLEVTDNGVASAWPDRRVSVEYFTVLAGMQPTQTGEPAQDVLDAVGKAQDLLYLKNDKGALIGYTALYAQYRHNQTAYANAVGAYATAYAQAMADPVAGQSWPVASKPLQTTVTQTLADWNGMGRREVEAALATINTVGHNAVAALVDQAHNLYDAYTIPLGGQVAVGTQWSYISPLSWWDHTDKDFGVQTIHASTSSFQASGGAGRSSYANSWYTQQSSSTGVSAGVGIGPIGGDVDVTHSQASNAFGDHTGGSSWSHFQDSSSSAEVTCEFFLATIERPWFLGDLLDMDGWYLVGHPKGSVSDGTVAGQIGETGKGKILPMVPKAFLIIRNVKITADDWGSAADSFEAAQTDTSGSESSSSTSVGVSASYLFSHAHVQHDQQQSDGAFGTASVDNGGWNFTRNGKGGTLEMLGSNIAGWVGQVQPASPKVDAPPVVLDPPADATPTSTGPAAPATTPAPTTPAPVLVPAGVAGNG